MSAKNILYDALLLTKKIHIKMKVFRLWIDSCLFCKIQQPSRHFVLSSFCLDIQDIIKLMKAKSTRLFL